ncbi:hypothetical protein D3C84_870930 [compost metagenome]
MSCPSASNYVCPTWRCSKSAWRCYVNCCQRRSSIWSGIGSTPDATPTAAPVSLPAYPSPATSPVNAGFASCPRGRTVGLSGGLAYRCCGLCRCHPWLHGFCPGCNSAATLWGDARQRMRCRCSVPCSGRLRPCRIVQGRSRRRRCCSSGWRR